MAQKSSRKKKKAKKTGRIKPFLWGFFFCLILSITIAATGYFVFLTPGTHQQSAQQPPEKNQPQPAYTTINPLHYEEDTIPEIVNLQPLHSKTRSKQNPATKPKVAIIIDDMGYRHQIGKNLIELDMGLSFAFLPFLSHTRSLMNLADQHGTDILLHLPMEASSTKWNPGPGGLYTSMTREAIILQVKKDLLDVPKAIGVNNHMGSKFTSNRQSMLAALVPIKEQSLFFLDSMTSNKSVAFATARELGIKTGRRDIFLDNEQNNAKIKTQLEKLVQRARKNGSAIGIGHPHAATLATLKKEQWWLKNQVEIVRISELIGKH